MIDLVNDFYKKYQDLFEELRMIHSLTNDKQLLYSCYSSNGYIKHNSIAIVIEGNTEIEFNEKLGDDHIQILVPNETLFNNLKVKLKKRTVNSRASYAEIPLDDFRKFFLESLIGYEGEALKEVIK